MSPHQRNTEISVVSMQSAQHPFCSPRVRQSSQLSSLLTEEIHLGSSSSHRIDGDPSAGSGQSELKTFWNRATIPDAIGNMCNSWEEVKISPPPGDSKRSIPTLKLTVRGSSLQQGSHCTHGANSKRTGTTRAALTRGPSPATSGLNVNG